MIDLEEKYINFIKEGFSKYLKNYKLYLFGSRAKGTAREYSDIDLAVDCLDFTDEKKDKLNLYFMDSLLPYKIDIIDLNSVKEPFKSLITPDLILL